MCFSNWQLFEVKNVILTGKSKVFLEKFQPKQANRAQKRQGVALMGIKIEEKSRTYDNSITQLKVHIKKRFVRS